MEYYWNFLNGYRNSLARQEKENLKIGIDSLDYAVGKKRNHLEDKILTNENPKGVLPRALYEVGFIVGIVRGLGPTKDYDIKR